MFDFTKAQQEAIETLDRNVSVSAGAGSGKTRVLVERFVNILRQSLRQGGKQVSAADILAITFTRKAAGEMKERVRRRLAELEQEDALHASFWQQQQELLEQARINTIHGFCNSLCFYKFYPAEVFGSVFPGPAFIAGDRWDKPDPFVITQSIGCQRSLFACFGNIHKNHLL